MTASQAYAKGGGGKGGATSSSGKGGSPTSSARANSNNHSNQLNPNNGAFWQSRGYGGTPSDWEARSTKNYDDNRSNQLNPNNDAYWQSRGYEGTLEGEVELIEWDEEQVDLENSGAEFGGETDDTPDLLATEND